MERHHRFRPVLPCHDDHRTHRQLELVGAHQRSRDAAQPEGTLRVPGYGRRYGGRHGVPLCVRRSHDMRRAWGPSPSEETRTRRGSPRRPAASAQKLSSQERLNVPIIVGGGLVVFFLMTFMVVAMPYMFTPKRRARSRRAQLTAEQQAGRAVYKANGCYYCHNQFVREPKTGPWVIVPTRGFLLLNPQLPRHRAHRAGLGPIGGKRPTEWHNVHDRDPRAVSPSSIMPAFKFLRSRA